MESSVGNISSRKKFHQAIIKFFFSQWTAIFTFMYHLQLFYIRPSAALSQSCRLLLKIDRMEVVEVVGRGAVTLPPDRANNPGRRSLAPRTSILIRNPHWKKEREIKFYVLCSLVYITQASWYIVSGILSFTQREGPSPTLFTRTWVSSPFFRNGLTRKVIGKN